MSGTIFLKQLYHVLEVFYVSTLIRTDGNTLCIFLNGAIHDLMHRPVVPKMYDLCPAALQYATHNIDTGIMTVKQACGCNKTDLVLRIIRLLIHSAVFFTGFLLC